MGILCTMLIQNVFKIFVLYRSGKDGAPKEYYTLDCLLFLLKHVHLTHPSYVRMAAVSSIYILTS